MFAQRGSQRSSQFRAGFTFIESAVAIVLLGALLVFLGQALVWVASERRLSDRRQAALLEAHHLLEQVTSRQFASVTTESVADLKLSDDARAELGDDAVRIDVRPIESDNAPMSKQITVTVSYGQGAGGRDKDRPEKDSPSKDGLEQHVELTTWIYQRGGP